MEDNATLSAGFEIDPGDSFTLLDRFDSAVESTAADAVRQLEKVEKASRGVLDLGGATASVKTFGNDLTKEGAAGARALASLEKQGEGLIRNLERQAAAYGKTREEVRQMRAETLATKLGDGGADELAARVLAASAALDRMGQEAAVTSMKERQLAVDAKKAADAHDQLAAKVRAVQAAEVEDAAALERLRRSIDPTRAAQARLNAELEEAQRLYFSGVTGAAEYAKQEQVLVQRLNAGRGAQDAHNRMIRGGAGTMTQFSFQLNDIATMAGMGAKPMQIFMSQIGQIFQVAQMAEGGVKGFAMQVGGLALRFAPLIAVAGSAAIVFSQWKKEINDDAAVKGFAATLGLTHKEMKRLGDTSVTTGDLIAGVWKTIADASGENPILSKVGGWLAAVPGIVVNTFKGITVSIYGLLAGTIRGAITVWQQFPEAIGDLFVQGANAAISAIDWLLNKTINGINALGRGANQILAGVGLGPLFGQLSGVHLDQLKNANAGAGKALGKAIVKGFDEEVRKGLADIDKVTSKIVENAVVKRNERLTKKANEIKADRTPDKPKSDSHAAQLLREAEATEAQIKNLYLLADAYEVSGAAALIAEARVKAESKAIKGRADVEAAVNREVRLSIAQRVSDGAKATAGMRDQADAAARVNAMVEAGLVPAARAADVIKDQIADLPLLQAAEAAQQRGLTTEAARATKALNDQRQARVDLAAAAIETRFNSDIASGSDQMAVLNEELRLIGATDEARVHALATLKATQEAVDRQYDPSRAKQYVDQQVAIADAQERNRKATEKHNDELERQKRLWDDIVDQVDVAAFNMERAFGRIGGAIGDAMRTLADYGEKQSDLTDRFKKDKLKEADYLKQSADLQLNSLIGITSAAKGLFKENSAGYKAMAAAEKALTIIQIARTAVLVANAAANMFATMGPAGFVGVGAMLAVMASLGFSGGGNAGSLPKSNEGKGTVLGDSDAQSKSIERAIDLLRDVDTVTMKVSREMLSSLRTIEANIGSLASLLVRTGNIDASSGVQTGFKTNATGKLLGNIADPFGLAKSIPILGDILGGISGVVKSLFGTKTSVVASGLFGGPQAIADVLNAGFDASYFSDVKKTKKFFGISTGSKYSTQYTDASSEIEQQFGVILRGFYDMIAAAAPALGQATSDIENRLNGFVVSLGKIDIQGLTGDEISETLTAVFGAAADDMARTAFAGLEKFQQVGEGMFETVVRVASTVEAVGVSLGRLGSNAQNLGVDTSMALAGIFGDVGDLTSAAGSFFETFYTAEEQAAIKTAELTKAFGSLGMTMPGSIAAFRQMVEAQDLTTDAGRNVYATLLKLAPAFADVASSAEGASSAAAILRQRQDLERQLLELQGDTVAIRALDLAKLDETNRALQQNIWAMQDQAAATQAATAAATEAAQAAEQAAQAEEARLASIASERGGLERQILEALGDTVAVRGLELAALDPTNRALQERLYALADEKTAAEAAAQAAASVAEKLASIAGERAGLERQLLEAQGATAAIRALDLTALDESNRAIQMNIWALQDQAAATDKATAAEQAIASERAGLMSRIWELTGDTASIRAAELAALDSSNRAMLERIYALQDEQAATTAAQQAADEATRAAEQLADAWKSIGDSIMDEVKRIRGEGLSSGASYASLLGQFNSATEAARRGDQDAAKSLTGLSQSMLEAAAKVATSRQELDRVQGVTASSLEETARLIGWISKTKPAADLTGGATTNDNWWANVSAAASAMAVPPAGNDNPVLAELRALRDEVEALRVQNNSGHALTAEKAGKTATILDNVTRESGGDAISIREQAA